MTVFLHEDNLVGSIEWHRSFRMLLSEMRAGVISPVPLGRKKTWEFVSKTCREGDCFIGRIKHDRALLAVVKPRYDQLCELLNHQVFPSAKALYYYDDKAREFELLRERGYPIPKTEVVQCREDVERFVEENGVSFPLVMKNPHGAGSHHVGMVDSIDGVVYPRVLQEHCVNDWDYRVLTIGNRGFAYKRVNRPNDFRASGSGNLLFVGPEEIDFEVIELCYRVSCENGFECMAYDVLRDNDGRWVILEFSYTFPHDYGLVDCPHYYRMPEGEVVKQDRVFPSEYIVCDFVAKFVRPEFV